MTITLRGMRKDGNSSVEARRNPLVHISPPRQTPARTILTREEVIDRINEIIVVPATRTIRGLDSEVVLTEDDGMPTDCALNFDHVSLAQRDRIGAMLCAFPENRWR